jgi:trk system potassium uptake protein TrkA
MDVVIVGGGKVGTYLAGLLLTGGHHVTVIESRREQIAPLQADVPDGKVLLGSGTDPQMLETAGINRTTVVAAVTGADETNLTVTSLARFAFHVPRTIARVNNPKNAWLFTAEMGVDAALNQADLMAHMIAEEMSLGDMMTLLKLRKGQFALVEEKVHPTAVAVGRAVAELQLPADCVMVAVLRKGKLLIPRPAIVLEPADEVLAVVPSAQMRALAALLGPTAGHRSG